MKNGATADAVWAVILCCSSIALLWFSYRPQESSLYTSLGGMFWPRILLWGILIFSVCLLGMPWLSIRFAQKIKSEQIKRNSKKGFYVFLACLMYFLLLGLIGFIFSTMLFLYSMAVILGIQGQKKVVIYSFTTVAIFWIVFIQMIHVPLPRGSGVFREISLMLFRY